jgi:hypothetical protein
MLYAWINFAKEYRDEMNFIFLFDFYYGVHESNEELKSKYKNFIFEDNSSNFFNEAINKGIADKSLKSDLDPVKVGCCIFQTLMGLLQRMSYTNLPVKYNVVTDDDIAKLVVEMIINSIKSELI